MVKRMMALGVLVVVLGVVGFLVYTTGRANPFKASELGTAAERNIKATSLQITCPEGPGAECQKELLSVIAGDPAAHHQKILSIWGGVGEERASKSSGVFGGHVTTGQSQMDSIPSDKSTWPSDTSLVVGGSARITDKLTFRIQEGINQRDPSVGTGSITAGKSSVTITNDQVTAISNIFLTIDQQAAPDRQLRVCEKTAGQSFKVCTHNDANTTTGVSFSYWIIN